jgi:hypothetical protein
MQLLLSLLLPLADAVLPNIVHVLADDLGQRLLHVVSPFI